MKKLWAGLSAVALLAVFGTAFAAEDAKGAEDAAVLYKTRCQSCHGPDGGQPPIPGINPIKGQSSENLLNMLKGFQKGTFGGPQKQVMEGITHQLTDDQMQSLADYISKL